MRAPKGPRQNNFSFSHPILGPSLPAPQSQNPRISAASPAVLLNRRDPIQPQSGRVKAEVIWVQSGSDREKWPIEVG